MHHRTVTIILALILIALGFFFFGTPASAPALEAKTVNYFENVEGYFVRPVNGGDYPGVVMIHENRGLRPEIKQAAEELEIGRAHV